MRVLMTMRTMQRPLPKRQLAPSAFASAPSPLLSSAQLWPIRDLPLSVVVGEWLSDVSDDAVEDRASPEEVTSLVSMNFVKDLNKMWIVFLCNSR